MHGIIEKPGDVDFFKFTAKKGQQLDVRVYARKPLRSPLDAVLTIHNAQGGTASPTTTIRAVPTASPASTIPADGDYFVSIRDQLKDGGPEFVYRVEITETKPALVDSSARAAAIHFHDARRAAEQPQRRDGRRSAAEF